MDSVLHLTGGEGYAAALKVRRGWYARKGSESA